jgi:ribosomal protein S4
MKKENKMETTLPRMLQRAKMAISLAEAKRYIHLDAVRLNGFVVNNPMAEVKFHAGDVLEVGKRKVELNSEHLKENNESNIHA